jgi:3-hydroxyacyl-CoA dehydrogenase/enoyl-CoA hydratase/3-hydroxybutyryl-CoA epimerase
MQFNYGMGMDVFETRCDALEKKYGAGFVLSDAVKASIRKFKPVY